jgi:hypothetical protein
MLEHANRHEHITGAPDVAVVVLDELDAIGEALARARCLAYAICSAEILNARTVAPYSGP